MRDARAEKETTANAHGRRDPGWQLRALLRRSVLSMQKTNLQLNALQSMLKVVT